MTAIEKTLREDDNVVLVGTKKPANRYALAIKRQFDMGAQEVVLRARGNAIAKGAKAIEITKARYFPKMTTQTEYTTEFCSNADGSPPVRVAVEVVTLKLPKKPEEEEHGK